jgi:SAM-dependent methyltransferase
MKYSTTLDSHYWDQRYREGNTGWDIGEVSTPLKEYILTLSNKDIHILIPGAGNSYEAAFLWDQGFKNITILDFAPSLIQKLRNKWQHHLGICLVSQDFFEHEGSYDLILEQTFFCAISPQKRPDYVRRMFDLLAPGGILSGVMFNVDFEHQGPPFGGHIQEYQSLFTPYFPDVSFEPCHHSIPSRQGREVFITARKSAHYNQHNGL